MTLETCLFILLVVGFLGIKFPMFFERIARM